MLDDSDREPTRKYGPWPWITGYVLAGVLMAVMFGLATGDIW